MPLGMEVGLGPGHTVLDGDPASRPKKATSANFFGPVSIVAKRSPISATAEHLLFMRVSGEIPRQIVKESDIGADGVMHSR